VAAEGDTDLIDVSCDGMTVAVMPAGYDLAVGRYNTVIYIQDEYGSVYTTIPVTINVAESAGGSVSGTITSYLKAEGDITVQLLSGEEVAYSQVFNTYTEVNASRKEYTSAYSIPAVADGTYTLRIGKVNHVTRDYTVTVNGGVLTQDVKIHLLGDVTGDGKINALDKKKIYNHINGDLLTGYEFDVANVKADTKINALDKKMIYNHINGESLWE
jgi:hypothetical protein